MSQWKNDDSAANSVSWGVSQLNLPANTGNKTALFGNTTADAFVTNETIGLYGAAAAEVQYNQYTLHGVAIGSDRGTSYVLTSNSTNAILANGGTTSVAARISVDSLAVGTVGVNVAGNSYVNGDIVTITGSGTGSQASFIVTANATGNVTAIAAFGKDGDYSVFPSAQANTSNTTGAGAGLVLDVTAGVGTVSVDTGGTFTVLPTLLDDNASNTEANQAGSGALLNYVFKRSTTPATHSGWVLVREGSGGKAGRVQTEVLVASGSMTGDAEDTMFANT